MSPFVSAVRVKSGGIEWLNLATRGPDLATFSVRPEVLGTMLLAIHLWRQILAQANFVVEKIKFYNWKIRFIYIIFIYMRFKFIILLSPPRKTSLDVPSGYEDPIRINGIFRPRSCSSNLGLCFPPWQMKLYTRYRHLPIIMWSTQKSVRFCTLAMKLRLACISGRNICYLCTV